MEKGTEVFRYYLNANKGQLIKEKCIVLGKYTFRPYLIGLVKKDGKTKVVVDKNEGCIYSNSLWLKEEDDERAINLFLEEQKRKIEKLNRKIDTHRELMRVIRMGVRNQ